MPDASVTRHQSSDSTANDSTNNKPKHQQLSDSYPNGVERPFLYYPQPEATHEYLKLQPYRVLIDQNRGEATVQFRADVMEAQTLHLLIPQSQMSQVMTTLQVDDDRVEPKQLSLPQQPDDSLYKKCGARCQPTVHFPSPSARTKTGPHRDAVWYSLLEANIGKYIHLDTLRGPREGFLLGLDVGEELATIILNEGGKIGIHTFDPAYPTPISLHASTSSIPAIVPHAVPHSLVNAVIQTYGKGSGIVTASYTIPTPLPKGFDFSYRITIPQSLKRDATITNARLQCSARVANPFDFDLNDVQFCLVVSGRRQFDHDRVHEYDSQGNYPEKSQNDSSSSSKYISADSNKTDSDSNNDVNILDIDMLSNGTTSDASWNAGNCHDRAVYEPSHPITMRIGQSADVWLFETTVTVKLCHSFLFRRKKVRKYFRRMIDVINTSSMVLEGGTAVVCAPDMDNCVFFMIPTLPGQISSGVYVRRTPVSILTEEGFKRVENSTSCIVRDGRLIIRMLLERTVRFSIHNKQSNSADISIEFISRVHTGEPTTMKITRHATMEDSIACLNEQPMQFRPTHHPRWWEACFLIEAEQKSVVVAREQFSRDKMINLIDACSPRHVANLKAAAAISQPFAEKLRLINQTRRKIERMKREQKHFSATRHKLCTLADEKVSTCDDSNEKNEDKTPKNVVNMEEHFASLESLENDIASILQKSEALAEKLVDIENEQKNMCNDLEKTFKICTNGCRAPDE